jgi:16S rRNA (adenine1518-N6/adenine1519-N6)-dimethyltransferase
VPPESFEPPPKVWSTVVRLSPRACRLGLDDPAALERVLRQAFNQRRKRLSNALQSLAPDWDRAGVDPGRRADDLTVAEFVALANAISAAIPGSPESTRPS